MDNTTLTYTAIQRVFRNAIVGYLRQRLSAAFGAESPSRLRKPFKAEEWEKMRAGSDEPRALGSVTTQLADDFDLLSVNHFFNLFDAYWEILKPSGAQIGANPEAGKRGLLG